MKHLVQWENSSNVELKNTYVNNSSLFGIVKVTFRLIPLVLNLCLVHLSTIIILMVTYHSLATMLRHKNSETWMLLCFLIDLGWAPGKVHGNGYSFLSTNSNWIEHYGKCSWKQMTRGIQGFYEVRTCRCQWRELVGWSLTSYLATVYAVAAFCSPPQPLKIKKVQMFSWSYGTVLRGLNYCIRMKICPYLATNM